MSSKIIEVVTVPNGYTLNVDGNRYMYHDLVGLFEGFMYHVGLEELEAVDRNTIEEFLTAAVVWRSDKGKTAKELLRLKRDYEALTLSYEKSRRTIRRLTEKCNKIGVRCADDEDEE